MSGETRSIVTCSIKMSTFTTKRRNRVQTYGKSFPTKNNICPGSSESVILIAFFFLIYNVTSHISACICPKVKGNLYCSLVMAD